MQFTHLKAGSIVDIVAPASRCSGQELKDGIEQIRAWGLRPRVPEGLFKPSVLFSNSDDARFTQLRDALLAPDSDLVWCVRGGYGALRLLPELHKIKQPKRAKMLLGYSDITTLHTFVNQTWGWATLHGPLLDRFGGDKMPTRERAQLKQILFGQAPSVEFTGLRPLNSAAASDGVVRGKVVGGNFAVLQSGLGTRDQMNPRGKILFLEDTGERPHRVDRMLTQFTQSGVLRGIRALVLGHFLLKDLADRRRLWNDVFKRFCAEQTFPIVAGLPVGHSPKIQLTLPLGTPAQLQLGRAPSLSVKI